MINTYLQRFVIVFIFTLMVQAGFGQQTTPKNTCIAEPDNFARELFKALQTHDMFTIESHYPCFLDVYEIFDIANAESKTTSDKDRTANNRKMLLFQMDRVDQAKSACNHFFRNIDSLKIDISQARIIRTDYNIVKKKRLVKASFQIYVALKGKKYIIEMKECVYTSRCWIIGNEMNFKKSAD